MLRSPMEKAMTQQVTAARKEIAAAYPTMTEFIPSFWEGQELYVDFKDEDGWHRVLYIPEES